jgi:hypothetical protein
MLSWDEVSAAIADVPRYWLATSSASGDPHLVQLSALWLDELLWFGGERTTLWARHLAGRPGVSVGGEHNGIALMLNGAADRPSSLDATAIALLAADSKRKYGFEPKPSDYERSLASGGLWVLRPASVLAWRYAEMGSSATAFDFD